MAKKRAFGTVRRLPSGRWQVRYRNASGLMVAAPKTFVTKGDANHWLAATEADQFRGVWLDPNAGRVTLEDYANAWLMARVTLSPRTKEIYAAQLRLHILPKVASGVPALGRHHLTALTPELVRAWYGALRQAKGPSTAAKAYTRLRQILGQAVDDDRLAKNPCRIKGAGAERHPEQRFATLEELYRLADVVPGRYRALILCAGLADLRRGELFALRRKDLDLEHAVVRVSRKRQRLASGETIEGPPKSGAGRRDVAVPSTVAGELARHLELYVERSPDAFVFTTIEDLPMEESNFRNRVWLPATAAAGVDGLRFHDLRHTAGTLAAQTGATTKELMARLGHASPQAAMIYQHASRARDRAIADGLDAMTLRAGLAAPVRPDSLPTDQDSVISFEHIPPSQSDERETLH